MVFFLFLSVVYFSFNSKLQHENLVRLYGITKSPLRMVLEFVPESDLNEILSDVAARLSFKWRLKLAIDCACGIEYARFFF